MSEKWKAAHKEEKTHPKWLKSGTMVRVNPKVAPVRTTVEGRWGEREVYIIETADYGQIYVSPTAFLKITEAFKGNYDLMMDIKV